MASGKPSEGELAAREFFFYTTFGAAAFVLAVLVYVLG